MFIELKLESLERLKFLLAVELSVSMRTLKIAEEQELKAGELINKNKTLMRFTWLFMLLNTSTSFHFSGKCIYLKALVIAILCRL